MTMNKTYTEHNCCAECRYFECRYAECRYTECLYAESRGALRIEWMNNSSTG
jgi:hypothetical protein